MDEGNGDAQWSPQTCTTCSEDVEALTRDVV